MSLPGDKKRLYTVILYDAAGSEARRFDHILARDRRDAYWKVEKLHPHTNWDAVNEEEGTNATQ